MEDCEVEGRIWTPSYARRSAALSDGVSSASELMGSAGVVTSSMHGMRDRYLGVMQGKGTHPMTVGQEIVNKLLAGDFVGLGGGFHVDCNLTGTQVGSLCFSRRVQHTVIWGNVVLRLIRVGLVRIHTVVTVGL
jgi:hypothetical protein